MKIIAASVLALFLACAAPPLNGQTFEYAVRHDHNFRDCSGTLKISADRVEYVTAHSKDSHKWKFEEIQMLAVKSARRISVVTYDDQKKYLGKDRIFDFILRQGKISGDLSAFLLSRINRPMLIAVLPPSKGKPAFEIRAKHLHAFGGAMGMLQIYSDMVVFKSSQEEDSRVWRIADIEHFGQPDRYHLEITGFTPKFSGPTETYNFQLLEDLPDGAYDYLWVRLHPSSYPPAPRQE